MVKADAGRTNRHDDRPSGFAFFKVPRRPEVLLVEDDVVLARAMRWAALAQCEVTAVVSAREARECLDRRWDALIFDINLPDGCGLAMMQRARELHPDAVALIISGAGREEQIERTRSMGATYLEKPFKPVEVLRLLAACLPRARVSGRPEAAGETTTDVPAQRLPDFSEPYEGVEQSGLTPSPFPPQIARLVAGARVSSIHVATAESERDYRLALLARAASTSGDFAANIDACARAVNISRQTLQDFASLTSRWEPDRVAELLSTHDCEGRLLTRTILLAIARGPSALRRSFEEQIEKGELDLATLQARFEQAKRGRSGAR